MAYVAVVFEHVVLRAGSPLVDQKLVFYLTAAPLYASSGMSVLSTSTSSPCEMLKWLEKADEADEL